MPVLKQRRIVLPQLSTFENVRLVPLPLIQLLRVARPEESTP